jgi:hypothetical protein
VAYSNQFIKVSYLFTLLGTDEIADTSLNFTSAPGWTGAVTALGEIQSADRTAIYNAYAPLFSGTTEFRWADYSELTGIKLAAVGTDGTYLTDPVTFEPVSKNTGDDTQVLPQSTIVVSLNTGLNLGGGNRGRMYLPHSRLDVDAGSPLINGAVTNMFAGGAKMFVNAVTAALNANVTATLFPAIMSQVGAGSSKGVTQVRVGDVNDTQRRRRNRLQETYVVRTLA